MWYQLLSFILLVLLFFYFSYYNIQSYPIMHGPVANVLNLTDEEQIDLYRFPEMPIPGAVSFPTKTN